MYSTNAVCFLAEWTQGTLPALGLPGGADLPAKQNDSVAEITAFFGWQNLPKLLLHLFRLFAPAESQFAADADAMGVAYHTARYMVKITQKQIGCFSTYAGQPKKLFHGAGNFPVIVG